jgi:hypothetical protein
MTAGSKDKRVRRQPPRDPLILAGHGVSLRVEAGTLLIRNGFTHYPQKQETYRYFKGDADLPPRIIVVDGSGIITFDVLTWLNEQKVPLVKIDWTGNAITVISGDSFAANRHRAAWQAETRSDPRKRMEFCNAVVAKKIEGCILTLEKSLRRSDAWEKGCSEPMQTCLALSLIRLRTLTPCAHWRRIAPPRTSALGGRRRFDGWRHRAIPFLMIGGRLAPARPASISPAIATRRTRSTRS